MRDEEFFICMECESEFGVVGYELSDDVKFCPCCGSELAEADSDE